MDSILIYSAGTSAALGYAAKALRSDGFSITESGSGATHILLDVPSFDGQGNLRSGEAPETVLYRAPADATVIGGNLRHPALSGRKTEDLLLDPFYITENAAITAHCAVKLALTQLPVTLTGCPTLVIGWGRIGKCLTRLLTGMGARVTVAARKETDRAMIAALGSTPLPTDAMEPALDRFRVIFNTVPTMVLPRERSACCRRDCLKIDLASSLGMEAEDVIWARGLPGKDAPETSGILIAKTVSRLIRGKEFQS